MKEYKVIRVRTFPEETEQDLNLLARDGWKIVCSFSMFSYWLVLERDKGGCKTCGR